jgi:hypothetical protein
VKVAAVCTGAADDAAVLCLRPEAAPLDSRVAPLALGEPLCVRCLAVASFPQPLLGALPPRCRFFGGVVVLVVGVVVLALVELFLLLGSFLFLLLFSAMACSSYLAQRHSLPFVWVQPHEQSPELMRR